MSPGPRIPGKVLRVEKLNIVLARFRAKFFSASSCKKRDKRERNIYNHEFHNQRKTSWVVFSFAKMKL